VTRFLERVNDYHATARTCRTADLDATLRHLLSERGIKRVGVPPSVAPRLADPGVQVIADVDLTVAELDRLDGCVTGCALAIAETGTIVLDGMGDSGRRALSLIPDYHCCIVRAEQVVADVPDAVISLDPRRPITFISGPSATSDIELNRVEGVHGPRALDVVVLLDTGAAD
jgi:L-lactate dehydrogenase complex protein LldG